MNDWEDIERKLKIEHGYYNILDGQIYYEGDIVPIYNYDSGTAYNGTVIKTIKPGFEGLVKIKESFTGGKSVITTYSIGIDDDEIEKWVMQPIPPDPSCYIIAPEPVAWRWQYAMGEIVKSDIIRLSARATDEDGDEFGLEA